MYNLIQKIEVDLKEYYFSKLRKNLKKKPHKKKLSHGAEARDENANSQKSSDVAGRIAGCIAVE